MQDISRQKILIVEDDEDVAHLLRDVLETKGYYCLLETQGETVMEKVISEEPALILLDIKLTGIDGYTVCRRIKREPLTKDLPVIFISALKTEKDVIEAKEAGGVYFLSKPFDISFLLKKVQDILLQSSFDRNLQSTIKILYACSDYIMNVSETDNTLGLLLKEVSFQVTIVRDTNETVRRAKEIQPDVILLDLDNALLPVWTIADALWRNKSTKIIPIIVVSSFPQREEFSHLKIPTIAAVLKKPISAQKLFKTIRSLINEHQSLEMLPV